eukprot:2566322-Prorocentrum_lima.AAC.1
MALFGADIMDVRPPACRRVSRLRGAVPQQWASWAIARQHADPLRGTVGRCHRRSWTKAALTR